MMFNSTQKKTMEINPHHDLINKMLSMCQPDPTPKLKSLIRLMFDTALI